jgi:hypothetical protein
MAQRITKTICASSRPVIRFYAVGAVNPGKCGLDCGLSFFGTTLTNQLEINGGHVGVNHRPRPLSGRVLPPFCALELNEPGEGEIIRANLQGRVSGLETSDIARMVARTW